MRSSDSFWLLDCDYSSDNGFFACWEYQKYGRLNMSFLTSLYQTRGNRRRTEYLTLCFFVTLLLHPFPVTTFLAWRTFHLAVFFTGSFPSVQKPQNSFPDTLAIEITHFPSIIFLDFTFRRFWSSCSFRIACDKSTEYRHTMMCIYLF